MNSDLPRMNARDNSNDFRGRFDVIHRSNGVYSVPLIPSEARMNGPWGAPRSPKCQRLIKSLAHFRMAPLPTPSDLCVGEALLGS